MTSPAMEHQQMAFNQKSIDATSNDKMDPECQAEETIESAMVIEAAKILIAMRQQFEDEQKEEAAEILLLVAALSRDFRMDQGEAQRLGTPEARPATRSQTQSPSPSMSTSSGSAHNETTAATAARPKRAKKPQLPVLTPPATPAASSSSSAAGSTQASTPVPQDTHILALDVHEADSGVCSKQHLVKGEYFATISPPGRVRLETQDKEKDPSNCVLIYGLLARAPGHRLKQNQITDLIREWCPKKLSPDKEGTKSGATFSNTIRQTLTRYSSYFFCLKEDNNNNGSYWTICTDKLVELNDKKKAQGTIKKKCEDLKHKKPNTTQQKKIDKVMEDFKDSEVKVALESLKAELAVASKAYEQALQECEDEILRVQNYQGGPPSSTSNKSKAGTPPAKALGEASSGESSPSKRARTPVPSGTSGKRKANNEEASPSKRTRKS